MKEVLISIQPYYLFLIIARLRGLNIPQEKTVEVRKNFPKDPAWNKITHIYCSKNRKSFNQIPVQYQPFMEQLLGKVIGEFVCDETVDIGRRYAYANKDKAFYEILSAACLTDKDLQKYAPNGTAVAWHISNLKIYDTPKELGNFLPYCEGRGCCDGGAVWDGNEWHYGVTCGYSAKNCLRLTRPPQSWCYVEELEVEE